MTMPIAESGTILGWVAATVPTGLLALVAFLARTGFGNIEKNITGVSVQVKELIAKMEDARKEMLAIQLLVTAIEARLSGLDRNHDKVEARVGALEVRLNSVEAICRQPPRLRTRSR